MPKKPFPMQTVTEWRERFGGLGRREAVELWRKVRNHADAQEKRAGLDRRLLTLALLSKAQEQLSAEIDAAIG